MKEKQDSGRLHITFHNPNNTEDTIKYLIRIIVDSLSYQAVYGSFGSSSDTPAFSPVTEERYGAVSRKSVELEQMGR